MSRMKDVFGKICGTMKIRWVMITAIVYVFMTWLIDYSSIGVAELLKITGGANILDFECAYSVESAYQMLEALGEAGRSFHLTRIMPVDIFFPISLMMFTFTSMSYLLGHVTKEGSALRMLPVMPVIDMLLDWTENIGITTMLMNYPVRMTFICKMTSIVSAIKFAFVFSIHLILLILLLVLVMQKIIKMIKK